MKRNQARLKRHQEEKKLGVKIEDGIKRNRTQVQKKNQAEVKRYLATLTRRHCSFDEGNYIRARYSLALAPSNNR